MLIPCPVVVGDDGDHSVVKAEYRHEDKALELEVHAEYRSCGGREHQKDLVHAECHDRTDGLHDDGRDPYLIDKEDGPAVGAESPGA